MKNTMTVLALIFLAVILFTACAAEPEAPALTTTATIAGTTEAEETTDDIVDQVKSELEQKSWENLQVIEGHVDDGRFGGLVNERTDEEKDLVVFTVLGHHAGMYDNPITAVVKISFSDEAPAGKVYKVFYVSQAGRVMDTFIVDGEEYIDPNNFLNADDQVLWEYMYSY